MANLDTYARAALAAFRDAFADQLATIQPFPKPLNPHLVSYKASPRTPFAARLIRGANVTGKFTTADFVYGGRASFWVTVGLTEQGIPAMQVSFNGFGSMEAVWPEVVAQDGDIAAAAAHLGREIALYVIRDRYNPGHGW